MAEQLEPRAQRERAQLAEFDDRLACDEFHHQIRRAVVRRAAVEQLGDVRMLEVRQVLALGEEAARELAVERVRAEDAADQLERDALLELAVGAFGEEHRAHAARRDLAHQPPAPDAHAGVESVLGRIARAQHEITGTCAGVEQRLDFRGQFGVARALSREPLAPVVRLELTRSMKEPFDAVRALVAHPERLGRCARDRRMIALGRRASSITAR